MIEKEIKILKKKYNNKNNINLIVVKPWFWGVPTRPTNENIINK